MNVLLTLLEITTSSTIIFIGIMIFRLLFKKHTSPVLTYLLWFILILRLIIPVTLDSHFHFFIIPAENSTESQLVNTSQEVDNTSIDTKVDKQKEIPNPSTSNTNINDNQIFEGTEIDNNSNIINNVLLKIKSLHWSTYIIILWLTGVIALILHMIMVSTKLKKIIKSGKPITKDIQSIINKYTNELRIKRKLHAVIIKDFSSPSITASINPVIIIPQHLLLFYKKEQIELAIKHELMHYKRKDHLMYLLLNFLRAVYWFNPIVWIMAKYIKIDMEIACDNMVVRKMAKENKVKYASTILEMYKKNTEAKYALGMALENTKESAERRLRGIFLPQKSKRKVEILAIVLSIIMFITCFTTACKPIEENEVLLSKGNLSKNTYTAPEKLNYKLESDKDGAKVNVDINASVIVPKYAPSVIKVKPKNISFDQLNNFLNLAVKDENIYYSRYSQGLMTKNKIQSEIDSYLLQISMCDSDELKDIKSSYETRVEELYKAMENAPVTYADVEAEIILHLDEMNKQVVCDEDGNVIEIIEDIPDEDKLTEDMIGPFTFTKDNYNNKVYDMEIGESYYADSLDIRATNNLKKQGLFYTNKFEGRSIGHIAYSDISVMNNFTLSIDEAKKMAEPYVNCVDNSLFLIDVGANKNRDIASGLTYFDSYTLVYGRQFNGVNTNYVNPGYNSIENAIGRRAYANPYAQEQLIIRVCKEGVYSVYYYSPTEVIETVNRKPDLLPFNEIQDIFDEYILTNGLLPQEEVYIKINSIELGMMRIEDPTSPNEYIVVPVWDFYGSFGHIYIEEGERKEAMSDSENERLGQSFLTINAIDGSIISRNIKY